MEGDMKENWAAQGDGYRGTNEQKQEKPNNNQPPSLMSLDLQNQRQGNKTKETEAKEETQRESPE